PRLGAVMKKTRSLLLTISTASLMAACHPPTSHVDSHTSRNALDWAGVYEGVLPCADCPGIAHRLTLAASGTYQLETRNLERPPAPRIAEGRFNWNDAGTAIQLDQAGSGLRFQVGEQGLWMLNQAGERI